MSELTIGPGTGRAQAIEELAAINLSRKLGRNEPASEETSREFAEQRLALAFQLADLGHTVVWDPPAGLASVRERWTCTNCGRAALQRSGYGPYGSALDGQCPGKAER